jgi:hypothetical protein
MNHRPLSCLWVCAALALCGCGGSGDVSGTVKYQGKPLPTGTIMFYGDPTGVWRSEIKEGQYSIENVPTGTVKITVILPAPITMKGLPAPAKVPPIPGKYADPGQSGLTYQVHSGQQTHDVELAD